MKSKVLNRCIILAALLSISLFAGCNSNKVDEKAVLRQQGIEYMEQGQYGSAVAAFEAALGQKIGSVGADEIDISYYKAAALCAKGDLETAKATYDAIIDYDKKAADAYYLRGCLFAKQGDLEAAKTDFTNAVKYKPNEYALYLSIYESLTNAGSEGDGILFLNQAFEIKGDGVLNCEYRGQIYYLLGEYENAIKELQIALEGGSTYANLYLAKAYDAQGESEIAESHFKSYIAAVPEDAVALNELGEIMLEKEHYADAVSYFEKGLACEQIPNQRILMHNLIVAYEFSGSFDKAWELIQEYVVLFPEDAEAQREYIFLENRQMKAESTEEVEATEESTEENTESTEETMEESAE